jgi:hypothetical protein
MPSHTTAAAAADPDSRPRSVRRIAALVLLVLGACAPPAAIRGADRVSEALHPPAAPETTRAVAAWSGGDVAPTAARRSLASRGTRTPASRAAAPVTEPVNASALLAALLTGG